MSGYDEIGAMNFANGYILVGGKTKILKKLLMEEYNLDEATANWHIEQAQKWTDKQLKKLMEQQDEKCNENG